VHAAICEENVQRGCAHDFALRELASLWVHNVVRQWMCKSVSACI